MFRPKSAAISPLCSCFHYGVSFKEVRVFTSSLARDFLMIFRQFNFLCFFIKLDVFNTKIVIFLYHFIVFCMSLD